MHEESAVQLRTSFLFRHDRHACQCVSLSDDAVNSRTLLTWFRRSAGRPVGTEAGAFGMGCSVEGGKSWAD